MAALARTSVGRSRRAGRKRGVTTSQQQRVPFPEENVQLLEQIQDHLAGRAGASGLDEAQQVCGYPTPATSTRWWSRTATMRPMPRLALSRASSPAWRCDLPAGRRPPRSGALQLGTGPPDGEPLVIGFDVVERDRNGQLVVVLGFPDRVPAAT